MVRYPVSICLWVGLMSLEAWWFLTSSTAMIQPLDWAMGWPVAAKGTVQASTPVLMTYATLALAVLEVDRSISCLKYDEIKPDAHTHLVRRRFLREKE